LDAFTGAKIWSFRTDPTNAGYDSSPTVIGGAVYVGAGDELYGLDGGTGTKLWSYHLVATGFSSPAVSNGYVYTSSFDGNVYALNATTGSQAWNASGGVVSENADSPSVAGGIVYVADSYTLFAYNASTGNRIWNYTFPPPADRLNTYYFPSSPAIANNVVYAVSNQALYAFGESSLPSPSRSPTQNQFIVTLVITAIVVLVTASIVRIVYWKKGKR
jgi:outer membrane protein assembly factor BamB